jgi:hypothetical protein
MFEHNDDDDGNNGQGRSSSTGTGSSGMRIMEKEYHALSTNFIKNN